MQHVSYVSLTRAGTIAPIIAFLETVGVRRDRILPAAELPPWVLDDAEALIPAATPARLFRAAARHADVPNLGLTAAERTGVEALGMFGRLLRGAPTLGAALEAAVRYGTMITANRPLQLRPHGDQVALCMNVADRFDPRDAAWQNDNHFALGLMIGVVRLATGPGWRPADVHVWTDEAPELRDADALKGTRIAFRQKETLITIPRGLLTKRMPAAPPAAIPADAVERWTSSAPAQSFAGSVRQAIDTLSRGDDYPTIRQTADFLGLSVRTLQRGLTAAGTSHDRLVGEARFVMAKEFLAASDSRILDLALDLGYSDHANFTRAFRRWAGCSPQEYRAAHGRNRCPGEGSAPTPGR